MYLYIEKRAYLWKARQMKCLFDSAYLSRTAGRFKGHEKYFFSKKSVHRTTGTMTSGEDFLCHDFKVDAGGLSLHHPPDVLLYFSCLIIQRPFTEQFLCFTHFIKQQQYRYEKQLFLFPLEDLNIMVEICM